MKRQDFTDFDAFRATIQQLDGGWLLNGGKDWRWHRTSLKVRECEIQIGYSHSGLITEGVSSNDGYSFYIPFKNHVWRHRGRKLDTDDIMVMEPGVEYTVSSRVEDGWHSFYVPKHLLESNASKERCSHSYQVAHQQQRADSIRQTFYRAIAAVGENPGIEFSPAAKMLEAELLSLLEPILVPAEDSGVPRGRPRVSRREIIEQSKAALEESGSEPIHVSELATQVGVSERTLRTAFNEYYQIGPRQYLQIRQLHAVRRDLLVSDPAEKTVGDTLTKCGVWEFGRFSGRYKRHFGELPSETLASIDDHSHLRGSH
jgi:AraC family ethanolamine operon transcriptional activator